MLGPKLKSNTLFGLPSKISKQNSLFKALNMQESQSKQVRIPDAGQNNFNFDSQMSDSGQIKEKNQVSKRIREQGCKQGRQSGI